MNQAASPPAVHGSSKEGRGPPDQPHRHPVRSRQQQRTHRTNPLNQISAQPMQWLDPADASSGGLQQQRPSSNADRRQPAAHPINGIRPSQQTIHGTHPRSRRQHRFKAGESTSCPKNQRLQLHRSIVRPTHQQIAPQAARQQLCLIGESRSPTVRRRPIQQSRWPT
ncbi:hypothetical protein ACLOJK_018884 [Asimina triloba]